MTLLCTADGLPPPSLLWLANGRVRQSSLLLIPIFTLYSHLVVRLTLVLYQLIVLEKAYLLLVVDSVLLMSFQLIMAAMCVWLKTSGEL